MNFSTAERILQSFRDRVPDAWDVGEVRYWMDPTTLTLYVQENDDAEPYTLEIEDINLLTTKPGLFYLVIDTDDGLLTFHSDELEGCA